MPCRLALATHADVVFIASLVAATSVRGPQAAALLLANCAISKVWVALHGDDSGTPAALWGAACLDQDSSTAIYWMLALEPFVGTKKELRELTRLAVEEMLDHFEALENHIELQNRESLKLLESVGFTIEPARAEASTGRVLHRVWITRADTRPSPLTKVLH